MMKVRTLWVTGITLLIGSWASASPITLPAGVAPGSTYYLAFVTSSTSTATSTNIADYNAFVTADALSDPALAALGTTWRVIGSTASVSATTNIGTFSAPIYNLGGQRVATGTVDLFDGLIENAIVFDQHGDPRTPSAVYTGGATANVFGLGSSNSVVAGLFNDLTCLMGCGGTVNGAFFSFPFYAISGPLVAPAAVPEPLTIITLGPALVLLAMRRRGRRRLATHTTPDHH